MKTLFISQPMNGRTEEEILAEREKAIKLWRKYIQDEFKVLDTLFTENPPIDTNEGLWYLGKAIQMLSHADYAFFCEGWEEARGCIIEHDCARKYDVQIL